jgi:biopolymer transport protein ExbD
MARKPQEDPQLDMTPMIDVVFELIIFFVVTIKPQDVFARLNVNRPAPASSSSEKDEETQLEEFEVGKAKGNRNGVYVYKKTAYDLKSIEDRIKDIAAVDKEAIIVVKCAGDSPHGALVDILDLFYKYELYNISLFSI